MMQVLGVLPKLVKDPTALAVELMQRTDAVVPLRLGIKTVYFLHHPEHLRHVMLDNYRNYTKGPMFARADLLLGNGLVLNEGEPWLRQRRLLQPPFSPQRLASVVPHIVESANQRLSAWRASDGPLEMGREMSIYTMSSLFSCMFGMQVSPELIERFDYLFGVLGKHLALRAPTFFLPERFPLPGRAAALAAVEELHRIIDEIVEQRRRSAHAGHDLLGLMLAARDEHGAGMSQTQLRDEIKTAIFGGYDSTASGLAWTWYMFATHPESARRAREEALRIAPEGALSAQQVQNLDYIGRAFQDTVRLYPPFSFHPRTALADDVIGDQHIPAGATLLYSNYAPGRNPKFWDYPDSFFPDHFLPEQVSQRHRFAYMPFAAGPRMCIGMTLALMEARVLFALALRELDIVRPLNTPIMQARFGTTRAKGGIWVELRKRRNLTTVTQPAVSLSPER